ncbi:unnamed protein product [Pedinophyceae sp. YPF-701]|nr:unnamed protein product [Pedinophyceae sp. YPF-701]
MSTISVDESKLPRLERRMLGVNPGERVELGSSRPASNWPQCSPRDQAAGPESARAADNGVCTPTGNSYGSQGALNAVIPGTQTQEEAQNGGSPPSLRREAEPEAADGNLEGQGAAKRPRLDHFADLSNGAQPAGQPAPAQPPPGPSRDPLPTSGGKRKAAQPRRHVRANRDAPAVSAEITDQGPQPSASNATVGEQPPRTPDGATPTRGGNTPSRGGGAVGGAGRRERGGANTLRGQRTILDIFGVGDGGAAPAPDAFISAQVRAGAPRAAPALDGDGHSRAGFEPDVQVVAPPQHPARGGAHDPPRDVGRPGDARALAAARAECERLAAALESTHMEYRARAERAMRRLAIWFARAQRDADGMRVAVKSSTLGYLGIQRVGMQLSEAWEPGLAVLELEKQKESLERRRREVEEARADLHRNHKPLAPGARAAASDAPRMDPAQFIQRKEGLDGRLAAIKRQEKSLERELERVQLEVLRHSQELKRTRAQEQSRFAGVEMLNDRYILLSLLGKGGFSEVFKAWDLRDMRVVACKLHQIDSCWSEPRRQNYIRHAIREYDIHKTLRHPNVVQQLDVFEVDGSDGSAFATVLEMCEGGDLDQHLKEHRVLPEKEARAVITQVLAGLRYISEGGGPDRPRVIHYDLKPANILFGRTGEVKISDFGLSKVVAEGHTQGLELTSQGCGTYWYLPPECFQAASSATGGAPRITSKVDVWAVGVILYQMLYGRRPFGDGMSQERILRDGVMLNDTREVTFDAQPKVSEQGKEFMRRCLAHRQQDRMDVAEAAEHPYIAAGGGRK